MFQIRNTSVLLLVVVVLMAAAFIAPANFSGEWTLNETKSKFGDESFGRLAAQTFKVKQEKDVITIGRSGSNPNGDYSYEEKLSFDGKEVETTVFNGAKRKSSVKWSADQKSFTLTSVTNFERDGNAFEIKGTEVWKLSDDGKSLQIESSSNSQFGTMTRSLVYDKK